MKTSENIFDYQKYFDTDLKDLIKQRESSIEYLEQNHFGDLLIEKYEDSEEKFQLWRNLDENIQQGEPMIQIEYFGKDNGYTWTTIAKYNNF